MSRSKCLAAILGLLACMFVLTGCHNPGGAGASTSAHASLSDPEFGKWVIGALASGDTSVATDIDWPNLTTSGINVGASYSSMPDEANKAAFSSSFITSYSKSFKATGASVDSLTDWTVDSQDSSSVVVSAQNRNHQHLKLTFSKKDGVRRLTKIDTGP